VNQQTNGPDGRTTPRGKLYVVRYGMMRLLGVFEAGEGHPYARDHAVVVRSDRGLEIGTVLVEADARTTGLLVNAARGPILRAATDEDQLEQQRLNEGGQAEFTTCRDFIAQRRLPMQLVEVEHLFGGEKIIFYFLADGRVDFRDLVKDLAREYQTRIEMRQIGVRDEAKLKADFGDCGKEVCCQAHMTSMPPVSMRMAKTQKATLDPAKISGRCGRLKCCLRFEDRTYQQLKEQMPKMGTRVETPNGIGEVVGYELLAQKVIVALGDRRRLAVSVAETRPCEPGPAPPPRSGGRGSPSG